MGRGAILGEAWEDMGLGEHLEDRGAGGRYWSHCPAGWPSLVGVGGRGGFLERVVARRVAGKE